MRNNLRKILLGIFSILIILSFVSVVDAKSFCGECTVNTDCPCGSGSCAGYSTCNSNQCCSTTCNTSGLSCGTCKVCNASGTCVNRTDGYNDCGAGCQRCVSGSCQDYNAACSGTDSSCYCSADNCVACSPGYTCSNYTCISGGCSLNTSGNTTLSSSCTLSGANHISGGNLTIASGGSLTIPSGASLTIDAGYKILMSGGTINMTGGQIFIGI